MTSSENDLVAAIRRLAANGNYSSNIIRGIGDDCAILRPEAGADLVFTTDFVLETRHFTLDTHTASDIGHKALARSLSDLAAMGSKPLFCLVSLAVPQNLGRRWVNGFYRGLLALAARHRISLAGGDLASFPQVIADVMCCGEVPTGKSLLRSGAQPGDTIYVSGLLGRAAHALSTGLRQYRKFQLRPEPQIELGLKLRKLGATSCMDLSDGLSTDLHRLCLESKVSAELTRIPKAQGVTEEEALHGGEDYQLLFTAPSYTPVHIPQVTAIGNIIGRRKHTVYHQNQPLLSKGFDHFA